MTWTFELYELNTSLFFILNFKNTCIKDVYNSIPSVCSLIPNKDIHALSNDYITQVYYTKEEFLPILHLGTLHPGWHPPSHSPVTLLHLFGSPQFILQFSLQLSPYFPSKHSKRKIDLNDNRDNNSIKIKIVRAL